MVMQAGLGLRRDEIVAYIKAVLPIVIQQTKVGGWRGHVGDPFLPRRGLARRARREGRRLMSRVVAYRIGIAILVVLAFWLLWSLAYEIVVALRWRPERFPSEGSSRWALFAMQNADRSPDFFLMAWRHFYARVMFPPTRLEAFTRAGYAAGVVILLAGRGMPVCLHQPPADALWRRAFRLRHGGGQTGPYRQARNRAGHIEWRHHPVG